MNEVYEELLKSKKYSSIAPQVLERVCSEAFSKYPKKKDAVKAAKTELHIIHESYLLADCHKKARKIIEEYTDENVLTDRKLSASLLSLHASSSERLPETEKIYAFLSEYVNENTALCDLGCGFSPFALPFFSRLPLSLRAYEINGETVELLNLYFEKSGRDYSAQTADAVTQTPSGHFDTVFLFKLLPVLQQQKKGRAFTVLNELDFDTAVISFPLKSLSGKEKGMSGHYSAFFEEGLPDNFTILRKEEIGNELFYVIKNELPV